MTFINNYLMYYLCFAFWSICFLLLGGVKSTSCETVWCTLCHYALQLTEFPSFCRSLSGDLVCLFCGWLLLFIEVKCTIFVPLTAPNRTANASTVFKFTRLPKHSDSWWEKLVSGWAISDCKLKEWAYNTLEKKKKTS